MTMSTRLVTRLLLLVQLAAALAIAFSLAHWDGVAPWQAALAGIASVMLVRLAINLNNFVLSACFASRTPPEFRLGLAGRLRLLAEEFVSSILTTSWLMPRGRARMRIHPASDRVPVLLLHGYGCNSGYWARLVPLLDAAGISHASIDLEPVGGSIDDYAAAVERTVEALRAATGARRVAIVAHSMGGLVARAWMRAHGSARVARLVTLGTPHGGTVLARFGPGANAQQMRRDGSWLQALASSEDPAMRALVTSIYTHHDNIVSPQDSSVLPGARHIAFGGVGHVALGHNPRVLDAVMGELAALDRMSA